MTRKQKKLEKKNQVWLEKYGVKYTDCLPTHQKPEAKTKKPNYLKKFSFVFGGMKRYFATFIFLGLIVGVLCLAGPFFWQKIIDDLSAGKFDNIITFGLLLTVALILIRVLSHAVNNLVNTSYHKMGYRLRVVMAQNVAKTNITKFDKVATGDITNRLSYSCSNFSAGVVTMLDVSTVLIGDLMYIAYCFYINVWLALMLVAIGAYTFFVRKVFIDKFESIYRKRYNIQEDELTSKRNELIRGIRDVKNLNAQGQMVEDIDKSSFKMMKAHIHQTYSFQNMLSVREIGYALLQFGFIALGVMLVINGSVSIGAFIVLIMYRNDVFEFFTNLGEFFDGKNMIDINGERMNEILDENDYPKEKFGDKIIQNPKGAIEFKNVSFKYDEKSLLENLSFKINPNECVGFVGGSGEGKSTIMSLITRFYDVQSGQILLDGQNIQDLTEDALRGGISVVPQTPYIFNLSLKQNLKIAKANATDQEIQEACKKANIHKFIESLPEKYDTVVGEGGVTLSGGQKQRIAIARAFLKPSKVLLFDEATSAIDNTSQAKILDIIQEMRKTHTVLIVAHRLSTIKNCDRIFVFENHKIIAVGSHAELMKTSEVYKKLYNDEEN